MEQRTSDLEDINAIRDLALRYAQAADKRDVAQYIGAFTRDGSIGGSGYASKGHEQLGKIPPMLDKRYLKTFHAVQNHRIALSGDRASGEVYTIAHHLSQTEDGKLTDFVMIMRYEDDYVRKADGWKFAHRNIIVDWTELREAQPHLPPDKR